jgi:hypothetical protein
MDGANCETFVFTIWKTLDQVAESKNKAAASLEGGCRLYVTGTVMRADSACGSRLNLSEILIAKRFEQAELSDLCVDASAWLCA